MEQQPPKEHLPDPDYTHTLTVRYSECDGQGVVFNAHYQALCDVVLDLWARDRMGKDWSMTIGSDFSMVVQSTFRYKSPAIFLDALTIHATVTRWGRTSYEVEYRGEVSSNDHGEVRVSDIFEGIMTYVCIDESKRPKVIPPEFKEKMTKKKSQGSGGGILKRSKL